jgi:polyisoprenyl-phosphate glycosyltransferase
VDDGSVRSPMGAEAILQAGLDGVIVRLRRNVGHQRAIAIGLGFAAEFVQDHQRVIIMDSDGEDLPNTVEDLLQCLDSRAVDAVVAERRHRVETTRFKVFYALYKMVFTLATGRQISFGNFMVLSAGSVRRLAAMQETQIHVAAAVLASRLRTARLPLDRGPRYAGRSKMNFVGLVLHGFKGMMVFAEDVLVRVGIASALTATGSVLGVVLAVVLRSLGHSTPGWFSIALGILVLIFLQTGALALMVLMLTGIVRSGSVAPVAGHRDFIAEVVPTDAGIMGDVT